MVCSYIKIGYGGSPEPPAALVCMISGSETVAVFEQKLRFTDPASVLASELSICATYSHTHTKQCYKRNALVKIVRPVSTSYQHEVSFLPTELKCSLEGQLETLA